MSLQHLQEVRGEQCFYLALLAKLAPKSQFQEGCDNTRESSKEGQKNDPGFVSTGLKALKLFSSLQGSTEDSCSFCIIANPLV